MFFEVSSFQELIKNLIAAKGVDFQSALIIEKIKIESPDFSTGFILYLWNGTLQKKKIESEIYMSLIQSLHRNDLIHSQEIQALKDFARRNEILEIASLLDDIPPAHKIESDIGVTENIGMEDVPLGVKKSLAKKIDKRLLNKLVHEQEPSVIEILLQNPSLVESDVLKIVTKRPTSQYVLKQVFLDIKWISRYSIKRAIILNPYSPPNISVALIPFMITQHLQEIANDKSLHEIVRLTAKRALGN